MNTAPRIRWGTWGPPLMVLIGVALVFAWIAHRTYWANETVYLPLRGEAAINPFYAAQRLTETLGAHTEWHHELLSDPPTDSIVVLAQWNWILIPERRQRLERWVEAGGRLVVDPDALRTTLFVNWSGIYLHSGPMDARSAAADARSLQSDRKPLWVHRRDGKATAMRVQIGRGSVTAFRDPIYVERALLFEDNASAFVAGSDLRTGDRLYFFSDGRGASLLQLLWDYLAPAVVLALALICLALWRAGVRFGPLAAGSDPGRRSLAEQIKGTGQFILRFGGRALHEAAIRALDEVALRRVTHFNELPREQRVAAIAAATGLPRDTLSDALDIARARRPAELRAVLSLLESARRTISPGRRT